MGVGIVFVLIVSDVLALMLTSEAKITTFNLNGIFPPVFTPVREDGSLNVDIIPQYAQYLKDNSIDGVLLAGEAGEGPTMNVTDKKHLLDAWMAAAGPLGIAVVMQVGGDPLPDAQELAAYSQSVGVDAIMTLPELFYKPKTAEELVYDVGLVAQAAPDTPILYYHVPQYTDVDVDMVKFLKQATETIPNFKGLKSQDFVTSLTLQNKLVGDQKIAIGDSIAFAPAVLMGFDSFMLIESNLFPKLFQDIIKNGKKGHLKKTRSLNKRLQNILSAIYEQGNDIASVKAAMSLVTGIDVGPIRPPEIPLTDDQIASLKARLQGEKIKLVGSYYAL